MPKEAKRSKLFSSIGHNSMSDIPAKVISSIKIIIFVSQHVASRSYNVIINIIIARSFTQEVWCRPL